MLIVLKGVVMNMGLHKLGLFIVAGPGPKSISIVVAYGAVRYERGCIHYVYPGALALGNRGVEYLDIVGKYLDPALGLRMRAFYGSYDVAVVKTPHPAYMAVLQYH